MISFLLHKISLRNWATLAPVLFLVPLSASAFGIQVLIEGSTVTFTDVPQSAWYAVYVQESAEAGIVNGYRDEQGELTGFFGPSNSITLAEALKIAVEGAGYDERIYGSVVDSGSSHWAAPYISVAITEDFELTNNRSRVQWNDPATRAEVASLFASAFRVETENMTPGNRYSDVDTSTNFYASVEALSQGGILIGDTDVHGNAIGRFRPTAPINRGEVVKMVIEARAQYDMPGEDREPQEQAVNVDNTITYTGDGFSPQVLRIQKGESVTFQNQAVAEMWVASNQHPTHTNLSGFDALEGYSQGETYIYVFNRIGTWGYHNHLDPSHTGTVIVE